MPNPGCSTVSDMGSPDCLGVPDSIHQTGYPLVCSLFVRLGSPLHTHTYIDLRDSDQTLESRQDVLPG